MKGPGYFRKLRRQSAAEQNSCREEQELRQELCRLRREMEVVQDHFENETDLELIDAHIWEMKSLEVRYGKAIREAKLCFRRICG